jgi:hypothetical protein
MFTFFVGKRARPRRSWEDIIRMNRKEIVCEGLEWMHLAHDRVQ